jgi:hypothetical protein
MEFERRKPSPSTQADLPVDYLRIVKETLTEAMKPGIAEMKKIHPTSEFQVTGAIYGDEVLVLITLSHGPKTLAATTVHASADYNPTAEKPGLEATLTACVDAIGSVFDYYLDVNHSDRIQDLSHTSMSALDEAPFEWTVAENVQETYAIPVWVKMDKTNPFLDALTDRWLKENDPEYARLKAAEKTASEDMGSAEDHPEDFLAERLDAIKKAQAGSGGMSSGGSGPITH